MPKAIAELGDRFLTDPIKVSVAPQSTTAERVRQYASYVNQAEKQALLTLTIKSEPIDRALIFTRTKHGADRVVRFLEGAGRSEEHTSELQSLMRISYAVFCLKTKNNHQHRHT